MYKLEQTIELLSSRGKKCKGGRRRKKGGARGAKSARVIFIPYQSILWHTHQDLYMAAIDPAGGAEPFTRAKQGIISQPV
jgi:hypothetical protein